jgi:hypothetical protein
MMESMMIRRKGPWSASDSRPAIGFTTSAYGRVRTCMNRVACICDIDICDANLHFTYFIHMYESYVRCIC